MIRVHEGVKWVMSIEIKLKKKGNKQAKTKLFKKC